jgi:hypothetical protein
MRTKLYITDKINFKSTYTIRFDLTDISGYTLQYQRFVRQIRGIIDNPLAWSNIVDEQTKLIEDDSVNVATFLVCSAFPGAPAAIPFPNPARYYEIRSRAYIVLTDEQDAIQVLLSSTLPAIRVHMWPSKIKFTVWE